LISRTILNLGIIFVFRKGISSSLFLIAGITLGLLISGLWSDLGLSYRAKIDNNPKFLLQPIAEHYEPKYDLSFMNYEGGVLSNKTDRFYTRGKDWIIIKDFPLIIDDYQSHYKDISDELWWQSPEVELK
jgi:hypothetical protein